MCKNLSFLSVIFLIVASSAFAADDITPADRDTLEQQQKTLLEQARQQRLSLENTTALNIPRVTSPDAVEGPCFPIHSLTFSGAEHLTANDRLAIQRHYQHRCLDLSAINSAVRETTNRYLTHGYITSQAYLQEQDLAGGTLTISVSEGTLEEIQLEGETPLAVKMAFPGLTGRILKGNRAG